jgi:hypothetical protein
MVREGDWKLSLCMDPVPHDGALYNLTEDPYERTNLFHDKEYGKIQHELTRRIQDHMKE